MAITLPLPVRVAAGIVATGIQLVRSLPEELPAIPVALVGNAMRLSMKVQQEITALATRGDELLGGLVGGRPQESPEWATFDEDKDPARPAPMPKPKPPARPDGTATPTSAAGAGAGTVTHSRHEPEASSLPDPDTTAMQAAEEVDPTVVELATHAAATAGRQPVEPDDASGAIDESAPEPGSDESAPEPAEAAGADGPPILPGYDGMTLAQVRGHLRELTADDVSALLSYEQSGDNRAPFLTLLSNRLVTLGAQES